MVLDKEDDNVTDEMITAHLWHLHFMIVDDRSKSYKYEKPSREIWYSLGTKHMFRGFYQTAIPRSLLQTGEGPLKDN